MKRLASIMMGLVAWTATVLAADGITATNVTIPEGGTAQVDLVLSCEGSIYGGFQFEMKLPAGVSVTALVKGESLLAIPEEYIFNLECSLIDAENNVYQVLGYNSKRQTFAAGTIVTATLAADGSLKSGAELKGYLQEVQLTDIDANTFDVSESSFNITIGEPVDPRTVLDENSTADLTAATGVDVRVKRTINANEWSTICLPFAMSEAQVKAAFGDDVQLADFTGWETTEYDASDNAQAIDVTFSSVTAIEANHPYVIKVSSAVTEFTVDGVDIAPEDDPAVSVGKKSKGTLGSFTGSYVPTLIDEECLFLNSNKFWYSTGKTNMKGYRGYFYFQDVLAAYAASAPVKMKFTLDGTTGIEDVQSFNGSNIQDGEIYDLAGRRVEKVEKGIYIINNKKVLVK